MRVSNPREISESLSRIKKTGERQKHAAPKGNRILPRKHFNLKRHNRGRNLCVSERGIKIFLTECGCLPEYLGMPASVTAAASATPRVSVAPPRKLSRPGHSGHPARGGAPGARGSACSSGKPRAGGPAERAPKPSAVSRTLGVSGAARPAGTRPRRAVSRRQAGLHAARRQVSGPRRASPGRPLPAPCRFQRHLQRMWRKRHRRGVQGPREGAGWTYW